MASLRDPKPQPVKAAGLGALRRRRRGAKRGTEVEVGRPWVSTAGVLPSCGVGGGEAKALSGCVGELKRRGGSTALPDVCLVLVFFPRGG